MAVILKSIWNIRFSGILNEILSHLFKINNIYASHIYICSIC